MLILSGALLACYALLCVLLYWQQSSLVYFPGITRIDTQDTNFNLVRGDVVLRGWRLQPGQSRALVYFGGNAERIEASRAELTAHFPDTTIYLLAYRGYGASDGRPSEPLLFDDAVALYDEVIRRQPGASVSVIGRSLGSGVASHLASRRPVQRLVLVTPFDSLARVGQAHYPIFPVRWLLRDRYESFRTLPRHRGGLLIVGAGNDEVIPAASTQRLVTSLEQHATVVTFADATHNDISDYPDYWNTIADFIQAAATSRP